MPIVDFLFVLPLWLLGTLLITLLMGIGLTALWAARRWVLPRFRITYNDANFAVAAVQSMVLLYGLIAALIAVGVWQQHSAAADVVSAEATAIANVWRDLGGYPEPTRSESREVLRDYTQQIIHEAWPMQQTGKIPTEGVVWMDRLQAHLFAFEPAKDSERLVHAEALRAFNGLVQCRRQRLDCVRSALPSVFWLVLLPGAIACTCMFVFFHVDNARFHGVLIAAVATFFALVLFVIVALDRPFFGPMGIPPDSYQLIYDHHMLK